MSATPKLPLGPLMDAFVVLYSLGVMASVLPSGHLLPQLTLTLYYLLVPGWEIAILIASNSRLLYKGFYTVTLGTVFAASVASIQTVVPQSKELPIAVVVPLVTVVILAFNRLHRKTP